VTGIPLNGRWKLEVRKWKLEDGRWKMENRGWNSYF